MGNDSHEAQEPARLLRSPRLMSEKARLATLVEAAERTGERTSRFIYGCLVEVKSTRNYTTVTVSKGPRAVYPMSYKDWRKVIRAWPYPIGAITPKVTGTEHHQTFTARWKRPYRLPMLDEDAMNRTAEVLIREFGPFIG